MIKKYELLKDDFIEWSGVRLYRIRACKSFGDVAKGTLGGYIEKESNLSHNGNCWIYDNAKAFGNARVADDAKIYNNAEISENSEIYGNAKIWDNVRVGGNAYVFENAEIRENAVIKDNAKVHGNAKVRGEALIRDNASVRDSAQIYGCAIIRDFAKVGDDAEIFGFAEIYGFAGIFGRARIYDGARIGGDVKVCGDAEVYGRAQIKYGLLTQDIKKDLIQYIACSLNIYPVNGKYILYKKVNKKALGVYTSLYDPYFEYRDGEYAEVDNPNLDFLESCGDGIHVSTPFYWNGGDTLIAVEVDIADVITCMEGKLRCRKVKVIGEV